MTDRAHMLSMGDVFHRPDGTGRMYKVLRGFVDGRVVLMNGRSMDLRPYATVIIDVRGPRCVRGSLIELCTHDCVWPDEAEELWETYLGSLGPNC